MEGSVQDSDEYSSSEVSRLAAISRKLSFRESRRRRDFDAMSSASALPTADALEVNTGSGNSTCVVAATSSIEDFEAGETRDASGSRQPEEMPDRDDVTVSTVSHADASAAEATGSRPTDTSNDISLATPVSACDESDELRVRFRFDSVSCLDVGQDDAAPLPKEPHPVRDQTVHRRRLPAADDEATSPGEERPESRLSLPSTSPSRFRRLSSDVVNRGRSDAPAAPRLRWLFRRHAGGPRRREKPSSALKKEIKAARQLGVIMGAFTVCFPPPLFFSVIMNPSHLHSLDKKSLQSTSEKHRHELKPFTESSVSEVAPLAPVQRSFTVCFLPYFICFTVVALCADCVNTHLMMTVTWIGGSADRSRGSAISTPRSTRSSTRSATPRSGRSSAVCSAASGRHCAGVKTTSSTRRPETECLEYIRSLDPRDRPDHTINSVHDESLLKH